MLPIDFVKYKLCRVLHEIPIKDETDMEMIKIDVYLKPDLVLWSMTINNHCMHKSMGKIFLCVLFILVPREA